MVERLSRESGRLGRVAAACLSLFGLVGVVAGVRIKHNFSVLEIALFLVWIVVWGGYALGFDRPFRSVYRLNPDQPAPRIVVVLGIGGAIASLVGLVLYLMFVRK